VTHLLTAKTDSPLGSESENHSALASPVRPVSHSQTGHKWNYFKFPAVLRSSHKTNSPASSLRQDVSFTAPPSYHSPQGMVFPELDSEPVSAAIPELNSTPVSIAMPELDSIPIVNPPPVQGPVPSLDPPFVANIHSTEVQKRGAEQADEPPVMQGNAGGPGWDNWNEKATPKVTSKLSSPAYGPSRIQTRSQSIVGNLGLLQQTHRQQTTEQLANTSEEKETETPLEPPRDSRHQTVYVAYRPSSSQSPPPM
jgi:hypothetical protein